MSQQQLTQYVDAVRSAQTPESGPDTQSPTPTETDGGAAGSSDPYAVPDAGAYPSGELDVDGSTTITLGVCLPDGTTSKVTFVRVAGSGGMGPRELEAPAAAAATLSDATGSPVVLTGGGRVVGDQRYGFGPLRSVTHDGDSVRVEVDERYAINGTPRDDPRSPLLGSWQVFVPANVEQAETMGTALSAYAAGETDYVQASERRQAKKRERLFETFRSLSPGDTVSTPAYATDLTVVSHVYDVWATSITTFRGDTDKQVHAVVVSNPRGGYYQLGIQQSCSDDQLPTCYLSHSQNHLLTPNTEFSVSEAFKSDEIEVTAGGPADSAPLAIPSREADESPLPPKCRRQNLGDFEGVGDTTVREVFKAAGTTCAHTLANILYDDGETDADPDVIVEAIKTSPNHKSILDRLNNLSLEMRE
ncbi:hypothetical protein ACFQDD_00510 [Halorubrum pallidum]|uniref:Uncharacterized protein n=1 Tax=Halorubrum pallidum TaxID=1526114 RepID=A0ABD5SYI7_9EURY